MLRALVSIARDSGLAALSLSVERANKAQHLYCSEGFRVVASGRDSDTMVRNLA